MTAEPSIVRCADVSLPLSAVTLHGELLLPPHMRGLVALATCGGGTRHTAALRDVAGYLARSGFGALVLDLRAPEEAHEPQLPVLTARLTDATAWLLGTVGGMYGRVALVGAVTAAAPALVAAARLREAVGAVATFDGRVDLAGPSLDAVRAPWLLLVAGRDASTLAISRAAARTLRGPGRLEVISGVETLLGEPWALHLAAHSAREWFESHLPQLEAIPHAEALAVDAVRPTAVRARAAASHEVRP